MSVIDVPILLAGSSPHTRGAPSTRWASLAGLRDHPRIRGEHVDTLFGDASVRGIIPAYAGSTDVTMQVDSVYSRIIPAYAGSTQWYTYAVLVQ